MAGRRLRPRATAVLIREGRVLLTRDRGQRRYALPGGGIKRGEPTISAVARELHEELRMELTQVTRLPKLDFDGMLNAHKVCLVEADGEPILRRFEIEDFIWWDGKEEVPLFPHVAHILSRMQTE